MFQKLKWKIVGQFKKDEETLHVIMSKEGSAVNNKSWTMFICDFRESLHFIASRPKMILFNHYGHPKYIPKKWSREDIFYKFLN